MLLIDIVDEHSRQPYGSQGLIAAHAVAMLGPEAANASLLPIAEAPAADLTVGVRWLDQDEVWLSCETIDHPLALGRHPLEALDGFEGNAEQLREIVELMNGMSQASNRDGTCWTP